jgi:hypothetical protein
MATQSVRNVGVIPFRWATALLKCCVPVRDAEMIAGDLLEEFREEILPARGWMRAQWWYVQQAVSFVPCRDTRLALRVCAMWFTLFCVTSAFSATRDMFAPAYGVVVFMFAVPASAFYLARKTDWFGLAFSASVLLMFTMLGAMIATILSLHLLHPPLRNFWFPIAVGGALAFLGALAGKMSLPVFEARCGDALRVARLQTLPRSSD